MESARLQGLPRARAFGREVAVAVGPRARLLGLAGLDREQAGAGLLIPRCSSVHTFWMRFELDLVFLDREGAPLACGGACRPAASSGAAAPPRSSSCPRRRRGESLPTGRDLGRAMTLPQRNEIASVVVCEDDEVTLELLCDHLAADRFGVLPAPSASDALRLCRYNHPDLLLLDLSLPDASGLDVLREIREADGVESRFDPRLPVIILTGRGADVDRVRGLEAGADDYMTKPFSVEELRARIGAAAAAAHGPPRRSQPGRRSRRSTRSAAGSRSAASRSRSAKKEFTLLRVLASDPTRVFTKDELLRDVWGYKGPSKTRTLDSHASRLRRKLDPEHGRYVVNCWGVGYRLIDG